MNSKVPVPETRFSLFTGKGGVGKTSLACAAALALSETGQRTLIVSTDPASNLDEVLGVTLSGEPTQVPFAPNLFALNIDPEAAAARYRERALGPYRGILPEAALRSMEEGLSGSCTTEIAAFDEFTTLLGEETSQSTFDRIVFDTAPTGHTLRLLSLPAAWAGYLDASKSGVSCLGPLVALQKQQSLYRASVKALQDSSQTTVVLVARPDVSSLKEAARTSGELRDLGILNQQLILNGLYSANGSTDPIARSFEHRQIDAVSAFPPALEGLTVSKIPLLVRPVAGVDGIRQLLGASAEKPFVNETNNVASDNNLDSIIDEIALEGHGVIITMGKGGVGKTSIAAAVAHELARRGYRTLLTTTDPADHVRVAVEDVDLLTVHRIDAKEEIRSYTESVIASLGSGLDPEGLALLNEDLRSPCTEEIAVFRAFADAVAKGTNDFVVIDTAPTGHTILLLDAAEAYHREILRTVAETPESVRQLLPRLRDPAFTKVLIVSIPEPTPVHEAIALAADLRRAGIEPFASIVNQSLSAAHSREPLLAAKGSREEESLKEAKTIARRFALIPWAPTGVTARPAISA